MQCSQVGAFTRQSLLNLLPGSQLLHYFAVFVQIVKCICPPSSTASLRSPLQLIERIL